MTSKIPKEAAPREGSDVIKIHTHIQEIRDHLEALEVAIFALRITAYSTPRTLNDLTVQGYADILDQ